MAWWAECVFGMYAIFNAVIIWVLLWVATLMDTPSYAVIYAVLRIIVGFMFIMWLCVAVCRARFYDPRVDFVSLLFLVLVFFLWLFLIIAYAVAPLGGPELDDAELAAVFVCWIVDTLYVLLYVIVETAYLCGCLQYKHRDTPCRQTAADRTLSVIFGTEAKTETREALPEMPAMSPKMKALVENRAAAGPQV